MWRNPAELYGQPGIDDDLNGYVDDIYGINAVTDPTSTNVNDDQGHGTRMAGVIGARGNNSLGVTGVAWTNLLMCVKAVDASGDISSADAVECIAYAVRGGARVLNMSWHFQGTPSLAVRDTLDWARNHGAVLVCAGGPNIDGTDVDATLYYPVSYDLDGLVGVTSINQIGNQIFAFGAAADEVAAPGSFIYTTFRDSISSYGYISGNSLASALAAGCFGILRQQYPAESGFELINRLMAGVDKLSGLTGKCQSEGRLNLHAALNFGVARPGNDAWAKVYPLPVGLATQTSRTVVGNLVNASSEGGEPLHGGSPANRSIWWKIGPLGSSSSLRVEAVGRGFDPRLAIYTGTSVSTLTEVTYQFKGANCLSAWAIFTAASSTLYYVAVDSTGSSEGAVRVTVTPNVGQPAAIATFNPDSAVRSGGTFTATLTGKPNGSAVVFGSSDLQSWTSLGTWGFNAAGTLAFTDYSSGAYRFYRAISDGKKSCNIVGYVELRNLPPGNSMIANPCRLTDMRISSLLPSVPDGTTLYKWDEVADQFVTYQYFQGLGGWFPDGNLILAPGEGVIFNNPTSGNMTLIFKGEVPQGYLKNLYPGGSSIRSSFMPETGKLEKWLGLRLVAGESVTKMVNGSYVTHSFTSTGWYPSEPSINLGESFWINSTAGGTWRQSYGYSQW